MVSRNDTRKCLLDTWTNRMPVCERKFENVAPSTKQEKAPVKPGGVNQEWQSFAISCCVITTNKNDSCSSLNEMEEFCFPRLCQFWWNSCSVNKNLDSIHRYVSSINVYIKTSAFILIYSSALSCDLPPVDDDELVVSGLPDGDNPILPDRFVKFSCKGPRKVLKGRPMVICGRDGRWDGPFPTCEGKAPHENIFAELRCETLEAKQWWNSASCAPEITCEVPPMHRHLRVIGLPPGNETVNIGHTLRFSCNNANPLEGREEIQCLESGQWSSPFPKCAGVLASAHSQTSPSSLLCIKYKALK